MSVANRSVTTLRFTLSVGVNSPVSLGEVDGQDAELLDRLGV